MPWRRTFAISATVHAADVAVAIVPPRAGGRAYGFLTTTVGGRRCAEDGGKGTGGGQFGTEGSATATRRSTTMEEEDDNEYDDAHPSFDDDAVAAVVHPVVGRVSDPARLTTTTFPFSSASTSSSSSSLSSSIAISAHDAASREEMGSGIPVRYVEDGDTAASFLARLSSSHLSLVITVATFVPRSMALSRDIVAHDSCPPRCCRRRARPRRPPHTMMVFSRFSPKKVPFEDTTEAVVLFAVGDHDGQWGGGMGWVGA
jgi:hypothetical protein